MTFGWLQARRALLILATCTWGVLAQAAEWRDAPLTQTTDGAPLFVSADGRSFAYGSGAAEPRALPQDFIPQARLDLGNGRRLVIGRQALADGIAALLDDGSSFQPLAIDESVARRLYFLYAFKLGDDPLIVIYDVDETMPSGRSGSVVKDGVDLYRLRPDGGALRLEKIADKLSLSGIDARYQDVATPDGHLLCSQTACARLLRNSAGEISVTDLPRDHWTGRVLIDLSVVNGAVRGLFRLDYDDRFRSPPQAPEIIFKDCAVWPGGDCRDVPPDVLPAGYEPDGRLTTVETCADIEALLRRDMVTMPGYGLTYFGMNNHEGRLPWGQVYVLDGMLDVIERLALPQARFDALRDEMRRRVALELAWWERLAETEKPGFWSRRYSLERVDIISVVHLARIARVVSRGVRAGLLADAHLTSALRNEIIGFDRTVERLDGARLFIRRGAPFWLDGANTPWNFQSGWMEGLAALQEIKPVPPASVDVAKQMIADFVTTEIGEKRPHIWQYCAGPCQEGWSASSGISVNKPDWEGNKTRTSTAHTSYRTMDTRAALEVMASFDDRQQLPWFPAYVAGLVEQGWLYPMTAAPLSRFGLAPRFSPALIGAYGRAATPFDNHNQIWVLNEIAKQRNCGQ